jgi:hypothetical protein
MIVMAADNVNDFYGPLTKLMIFMTTDKVNVKIINFVSGNKYH